MRYRYLLTLVLSMLSTAWILAQSQIITGTVRDENQSPLPGVSVVVKGTTTGITTDGNGAYRIGAGETATLVFSYVGYVNQEVSVGNRSVIDLSLQPDARALQEVTVTALGIQREKKALGYSAQTISGEASTLARDNSNIVNTLSGKVAGLQIQRAPGGLGASSRIVIRGNNSLNRNNQPLIVVDGVPINNFQTNSAVEWGGSDRGSGLGDINPDDVETMTVLKGPEATALYGVQGGNGAIIITTRKGKTRKGVGVQVNSNYTFDTPLFLPEVQREYAQGSGGNFDLKSGAGWGPRISGQPVDDWRNPGQQTPLTSYDNRFRDFLQTGSTFANSVQLTGGSDKTSFFFSYTNTSAKGILPTNTLNRNVGNLRVEHKLNDRITVDAKITYTNTKGFNRPRLSGDPENAYGQVLYLPANVNVTDLNPPFDELRRLRIWNPGGSNVVQNPYWTLQLNTTQDVRDRFLTLASVTYKITDWLSLMGRHSMDYYSDVNEGRLAFGQRYNEPTGNYAQDRTSARTVNADYLLTATREFGNIGTRVSLGGNIFNVNNSSMSGANNGNLVPDFYNLGSGLNERRSLGNSIWRKRITSVYALGSFDYKNYAFLEATYRTDWSSTLPVENQRFSYPSVSASLVLSDMIADLSGRNLPNAISFLKLRAAFAKAGNDIDPFELQPTYALGSGAGAIVTSVPRTIFNPNIKPELIESREVGLEARFLNNRVGLEFSLYRKNAFNQRIYLPVPPGSGFDNRIINGGNVQNAGIELVLNATPVKLSNGFQWDIAFNLARNRNKLVELHPEAKTYILTQPRAVFILAKEGELFGDFYGRGFKRNPQGQVVVDKDGLPILADSKTDYLGNVQPRWLGGINNTLTYKNLSMSFLIDIRQGGKLYSETMSTLYAVGMAPGTLANREGGLIVEGVTEAGERNAKAVTAQQYWEKVAGANNSAAPFVYDASNIMLREFILNYRLPAKLFGSSFVREASFGLVGRNLFLISKHPDTPAFVLDAAFSTGNDIGIESGSLPQTRSFGANLRLNF